MDESDSTEQPSARVIEQRCRNRVIEYLQLAASFDEQLEYEVAAPIAHIPYEVINQWEDWVPVDPRCDEHIASVYDADEVEAMCQVQVAWQVACDAVPDDYPTLAEVQALREWEQLRDSAMSALSVFMRRGVMPEDREA